MQDYINVIIYVFLGCITLGLVLFLYYLYQFLSFFDSLFTGGATVVSEVIRKKY